jgi:hypothetical protein
MQACINTISCQIHCTYPEVWDDDAQGVILTNICTEEKKNIMHKKETTKRQGGIPGNYCICTYRRENLENKPTNETKLPALSWTFFLDRVIHRAFVIFQPDFDLISNSKRKRRSQITEENDYSVQKKYYQRQWDTLCNSCICRKLENKPTNCNKVTCLELNFFFFWI